MLYPAIAIRERMYVMKRSTRRKLVPHGAATRFKGNAPRRRSSFGRSACCLAVMGSTLLLAGCRVGSADSVSRNVGINVAGLYRGQISGRVVSQHSGSAILHFNVVQDGSRLQAIDNNGMVFRGNIGAVAPAGDGERTASFTLRGSTTAGAEGVISGSFRVESNGVRMQGTWSEPQTFGNVNGLATNVPQENGDDPDNGNDDNGNDNNSNGVNLTINP